ncbi:MAG TPA: Crp/Fnr family transcriptional regulator [Burkholderiales bacterium]|nr:Crp/Fnr family transcriptional regulator [Burkholderiales bacterium]HXJ09994.1 Crp/Fnr family transcriptional regulator [Burkholderiales bacterium]
MPSGPDFMRIRAALAASLHFRGLPAEDLDRLAALGRLRTLEDGELVLPAGSPQKDLWIVVEGCLRLSTVTRAGKEFLYAMIGPGNYFGLGSVLRGKSPPSDAHAAGRTTLAVLDGPALLALFDERPRLWRHMANLIYMRLTLAMVTLRDVNVAPLPQRIVRRLLGHAISTGQDVAASATVELRLTQGELGRMLATSRSRVNGALKTMEKSGLVKVGYRTITLADLPRMRELAGADLFSF